ncbi:collagenase [Streptomyces sp. ISL-36]|uniref:collagenase n=1 Tax=Streptomyces sp. ISL-36 TaxID=2819182 RepID=UPI001BE84FB7|nr:collagenase [Streptomyces sp. ISL-36]MBT2443208.1 collagenase [Streptomyces sp. ISL-36]
MSQHRAVRTTLLAAALAATLAAPLAPSAQAVAPGAVPATFAPQRTGAPAPLPYAANPRDEVERLAEAPAAKSGPAAAPRGVTAGRVPGPQSTPITGDRARSTAATTTLAGVPCTLDGITKLTPTQLADFLADPAVQADGCLRGLIWTWDARLAPVMSDAHVQAVATRIAGLAAGHDGVNSTHLLEMFTYLHAVAYHDFGRPEIDITDAPTVEAIRKATSAYAAAPRTFDVTPQNAQTLREALYTGSAPGLRHHQLRLITQVLARMDADHPQTAGDPGWGGAALAALSVNYLGVYPGNQDTAFHTAVAQDPAYRAAFKAFSGHKHLKSTANAWAVRDALSEYGRFGQIEGLRPAVVTDLGALLSPVERDFGTGSAPWASLVNWLNHYDACAPYGVCKADIEARIFPHTYTYDNGAIKVRTGLDRATVDQLYYASKQVKAQFHRVLGTEQPLAGDPNTVLTIVLYASRQDYETYHPLLTGMGTENGGIYIERGATFYTYQRRVPQDSSLTLEELFRHEYVHYLNGRYAVPGFFGEGPWYENDRTTAMDEGTAEFFDGATRDDGIAVRKSLVQSVIRDTASGGPRMTVDQILHATYDGDGFRFYSYAGTFFEYLWTERPAHLRAMYGYLRAGDVRGYDTWRDLIGKDPGTQRGYDAFLDRQIAQVDDLFVPNTTHQPTATLRHATPAQIRGAFAAATSNTPTCTGNGDPLLPRFVCTGRITANLTDSTDPDRVFKDMSETVDYFVLDRSLTGGNNFNDMNCSFGPVQMWSKARAGTSTFTCEGPLRR